MAAGVFLIGLFLFLDPLVWMLRRLGLPPCEADERLLWSQLDLRRLEMMRFNLISGLLFMAASIALGCRG